MDYLQRRLSENSTIAVQISFRKKSRAICSGFFKFSSPIPWMLEIIILFEIAIGKFPEAAIIFALLLFNGSLSFWQEDRSKKALILLKKRLSIQARVLRDGKWQLLPASRLVTEDIIQIRMGDIIPADVHILSGSIAIDESMLTGESLPVIGDPGKAAYAGSIAVHGEAIARVAATGSHTYFGKTAEMLSEAAAPSHLQKTIFFIVKYLVIFAATLILALFIDSIFARFPLIDLIPFALLLLVASVPVALPATYTLSTALALSSSPAKAFWSPVYRPSKRPPP